MDGSGTSAPITTPDGSVALTIPPGTLSSPTSVTISEGPSQLKLGTRYYAALLAELSPEGQTFDPPVAATFRWEDTDNDGYVDGSSTQESTLRMYRNGQPIAGPCSDPNYQMPACTTACGGHECCCDTAANTWTMELTQFSQYVIGDSTALMIPGGGSPKTDCMLELERARSARDAAGRRQGPAAEAAHLHRRRPAVRRRRSGGRQVHLRGERLCERGRHAAW